MRIPDQREVIQLVRDHYGLSFQEAIKVMKIPLHPEMLRDKFAGQVLAGITANPETGCQAPRDFAYFAYQVADAMLKERIKNETAPQ